MHRSTSVRPSFHFSIADTSRLARTVSAKTRASRREFVLEHVAILVNINHHSTRASAGRESSASSFRTQLRDTILEQGASLSVRSICTDLHSPVPAAHIRISSSYSAHFPVRTERLPRDTMRSAESAGGKRATRLRMLWRRVPAFVQGTAASRAVHIYAGSCSRSQALAAIGMRPFDGFPWLGLSCSRRRFPLRRALVGVAIP